MNDSFPRKLGWRRELPLLMNAQHAHRQERACVYVHEAAELDSPVRSVTQTMMRRFCLVHSFTFTICQQLLHVQGRRPDGVTEVIDKHVSLFHHLDVFQ